MYKRRQSQSGFTLIELLVTIVVLVIIVALAAPSFSELLDRRRIVNAADAMLKQVQQARAVAIETNRPIRMVFRNESGEPWCFGLTDGADCDCSLKPTPDINDIWPVGACTIPLASERQNLAAADRVLVQASGIEFRGVQLRPPAHPLRFEPLRGLRIDSNGATAEIGFFFLPPKTMEALVVVNVLGRAGTCSPDGTVSTMKACPP